MSVDIGKYNADPELYQKLIDELYQEHPPTTLPPEYSYFIRDNLLRFMIRLARYKFAARMLKKTDRVLEIGSGSGLGSIFLAQHCAHVTGIEPKQTERDEANSINRRSNVEFSSTDFFDLDESKQYDVTVALDVIEHIPPSACEKFVSALAKHTRPDGLCIIGTPSAYSYPYQGELSRASHVKCYEQEELIRLLEHGFGRILPFSMNDEMVHTGHPKMAWYYFAVAVAPRK